MPRYFAMACVGAYLAGGIPQLHGRELVGQQDFRPTMVLPGYSPISARGQQLQLGGGRIYEWHRSLLPVSMSAAGQPFVGPILLNVQAGGRDLLLGSGQLKRFEGNEESWDTDGSTRVDDVEFSVRTQVDYDGLLLLTIELNPLRPILIDSLELRVPVATTAATRMMNFSTDDIRDTLRNRVVTPSYRGPFVNVVGLVDGARSFWIFADSTEGWPRGERDRTLVSPSNGSTEVVQRLIAGGYRLDHRLTFKIGLLVTPVRDGTPWRTRERRVAAVATRDEGLVAGQQLWWIEALAHEDLPYTTYPGGVRRELPPADLAAYHGPAALRAESKRAAQLGITRLPYFSGHAISLLDPLVNLHRRDWEVSPPYVMPAGSDGPFTLQLERPWLSMRSEGLAKHLIGRLGDVMDETGLRGLYLDQANVIDSDNPAHGGWTDDQGQRHAALDILATRAFYMRLAETFHRHGGGNIVVHNIGPAVIPAFSFVDAIVSGEEFAPSVLHKDYFDVVSLDSARSEFSPDQYGIQMIWLEELWQRSRTNADNHVVDNHIQDEANAMSWRQYAAMVLLHDASMWSIAPLDWRSNVYRVLDQFDIAHSHFVGYWQVPPFSDEEAGVLVSYYRSALTDRALFIVVNASATRKQMSTSTLCEIAGPPCSKGSVAWVHRLNPATSRPLDAPVFDIGEHDFLMVEMPAMRSSHADAATATH